MRLLNLGCGCRYHPAWVNVDVQPTGPGVILHDLRRILPYANGEFDAVYHSHILEHFPKRYAPMLLRECYRVLKVGGIIRVVVPDLEGIARLYLESLEGSLGGDEEALKRYDWILLEMLDQMVRNRPGGGMLAYWKQNPMPAEAFVIERLGSEVLNALVALRSSTEGAFDEETEEQGPEVLGTVESDALRIGQFRLSGEVHQWMYDRYSLSVLLREAGFQKVHICGADESDIPNFNSYLLDIEADGSVRKPDSLFMEGSKLGL